jgi:hypothetical protein
MSAHTPCKRGKRPARKPGKALGLLDNTENAKGHRWGKMTLALPLLAKLQRWEKENESFAEQSRPQ